MAIQIIDNFNLGVAKPIDDRFVVGSQSFYTDKNNIPYKYSGLRVWDLDAGVPYVWNGSSWISENSVSISGSGNANYVPKFIGSGSSTVIADSCIYISGSSVGINNITPAYTLDVTGTINSSVIRSSDGSNILLLNASNISSGLLSLSRLTNGGSTGQILTSGVSQPNYVNPSTLTVGGSSASVVFSDTTDSNLHYLAFFSGYSGLLQTKVSRVSGVLADPLLKQLTYQPSTGILTSALVTTGTFSVGLGSVSSPSIRFNGILSTGIYSSGLGLGVSVLGSGKLHIDSLGVSFGTASNFYPRVISSSTSTAAAPSYTWYGDTNTGMYRPSADTIAISTGGVDRFIVSSTTATMSGISMISSTYSNKWTITSIGADLWVSNLLGSTSVSATDLPSTSYARIISPNPGTSGDVQVELQAETTPGGTFEMLNRSAPGGFNGTMMILPANKKWRAKLDWTSGSGTVTFHIYKFGLGY